VTPLLLVLVLLAATTVLATVGLERWLRTRGLQQLEERVAAELGAPCTVTVTTAPGPLRHLRAVLWDRRLAGVLLEATEVPLGGARAHLASLTAHVEELPLVGRRLGPRPGRATGTFRAHLEDGQLGPLLGLPPVVQGVFVHGEGLRVTTYAGVALTCDVVLEDGGVVVRPRSPSALARLPWPQVVTPLPELPLGARVERLTLEDGHAVAEGTFDASHLH
jgi:hypothetical protein